MRLSEYYELILAKTGLFDWKYGMCQIGGFALAIGLLLQSFGFHGKEKEKNSPVHTGAVKVFTGRDVVTYEMLKWMQKLYGCTV